MIASKAGYTYVEETREAPGENGDPDYIRWACDESLRRLGTDHIDLYQFHLGGYDLAKADDVLAVFEELVAAGKVRAIGWSTDSPERAAVFAKSEHCKAIQQHFNVFGGNDEVLELCERNGLASIVRGPLGMGLLTGKFDQDSSLPADDVRHGWNFRTGDQAESLRRLDAIRDVLTSDGRTLAQGALAWLWARSEAFIPIPGFKTVSPGRGERRRPGARPADRRPTRRGEHDPHSVTARSNARLPRGSRFLSAVAGVYMVEGPARGTGRLSMHAEKGTGPIAMSIPATMRALQQTSLNGPQDLRLITDAPVPSPARARS